MCTLTTVSHLCVSLPSECLWFTLSNLQLRLSCDLCSAEVKPSNMLEWVSATQTPPPVIPQIKEILLTEDREVKCDEMYSVNYVRWYYLLPSAGNEESLWFYLYIYPEVLGHDFHNEALSFSLCTMLLLFIPNKPNLMLFSTPEGKARTGATCQILLCFLHLVFPVSEEQMTTELRRVRLIPTTTRFLLFIRSHSWQESPASLFHLLALCFASLSNFSYLLLHSASTSPSHSVFSCVTLCVYMHSNNLIRASGVILQLSNKPLWSYLTRIKVVIAGAELD